MDQLTARIYCIIPEDLADELHDLLRRFFRDRPETEAIVERRTGDRRELGALSADLSDRRVGATERRLGDRRALTVLASAPPLPRRARRHRDRLLFVKRLEPARVDEDADSDRLITAFQAGDREAFALLYLKYFDRIFSYMRVILSDGHEAEDATQQVFLSALGALDRYRVGGEAPFHAWLVSVARNQAIDFARKNKRVVVTEPEQIASWREHREDDRESLRWTLEWISDSELLMLIERLPALQRRVIAMRYMLGFTTAEVAEVLDQTPASVRQMQSRALRFLAGRLSALGRQPAGGAPYPFMVMLRQAPVLRTRRFALGRRSRAATHR